MTESDQTFDIFRLPEYPPEQLPLAAWYAQPLTEDQAHQALEQAQQCLQRVYGRGGDALPCDLLLLIARFRLQQTTPTDVGTLLAALVDQRQQALVQLVYGQLLVSVRHWDAMARLDAGFALAANLLSAEEYFLVMKRHDALRVLPFDAQAATPQPIETLLIESAVIQRLRGPQTGRPESTEGAHLDTLD